MPSRRALALAGAGMAGVVASRGFGTPALAVLGAGLVALPVLAALLVGLTAAGLRVRRTVVTAEPRAGEPLTARTELEGWATRLGLPRLLVCTVDPGVTAVGGGRAPREEGEGRWRLPRAARGHHRLPAPAVTVADPFGVASRRRARGGGDELVVPPEAPEIGGVPAAPLRGRREGRRTARTAGWGELDRVREYRAGDPLSLVHWGQTAKRGRLQTKELRGEDGERPATLVLLDAWGEAGDDGPDGPFEVAVSAAAAVVRHLESRGHAVALTHSGRRAETVPAGPGAWRAAESVLARVRPDGDRPPSAALRAALAGGRHGQVVLVTAAPDAALPGVAAHAPDGTPVSVILTAAPPELAAALTAAGAGVAVVAGRREIATALGPRTAARRAS